MGFFDKLKKGMSKTRDNLSGKIGGVFSVFSKVDEDLMEELEETLILCDGCKRSGQDYVNRQNRKLL